MSSKVQPPNIPLPDAVNAILDTAIRRARRLLRTADTTGTGAVVGSTARTRVGDTDVRIDVTVRGPGCAYAVPSLDTPTVWPNVPAAQDDEPVCGGRRPGCSCGDGVAPERVPCVLVSGHAADHRDAFGLSWPRCCQDCGAVGVPLDELSVCDASASVYDANLCGSCAAVSTTPYVESVDLLGAHVAVARAALVEVEATDAGTAAWNTVLYERAMLRATLRRLVDAVEAARA